LVKLKILQCIAEHQILLCMIQAVVFAEILPLVCLLHCVHMQTTPIIILFNKDLLKAYRHRCYEMSSAPISEYVHAIKKGESQHNG